MGKNSGKTMEMDSLVKIINKANIIYEIWQFSGH